MRHKQTMTWLLVADGIGGQLYHVTHEPFGVEPLADGRFYGVNAMTRDLESDRPGTTHESFGGARHAIERHSSAHERQKAIVARHMAHAINAASLNQAFQKLLIVAPAHTLGELRSHLSKGVHELITLEHKGEWTKLSPTEILAHLKPLLELPATT